MCVKARNTSHTSLSTITEVPLSNIDAVTERRPGLKSHVNNNSVSSAAMGVPGGYGGTGVLRRISRDIEITDSCPVGLAEHFPDISTVYEQPSLILTMRDVKQFLPRGISSVSSPPADLTQSPGLGGVIIDRCFENIMTATPESSSLAITETVVPISSFQTAYNIGFDPSLVSNILVKAGDADVLEISQEGHLTTKSSLLVDALSCKNFNP